MTVRSVPLSRPVTGPAMACEPGQFRPLGLSSGSMLSSARKEIATDKGGYKPRAAADAEKHRA